MALGIYLFEGDLGLKRAFNTEDTESTEKKEGMQKNRGLHSLNDYRVASVEAL